LPKSLNDVVEDFFLADINYYSSLELESAGGLSSAIPVKLDELSERRPTLPPCVRCCFNVLSSLIFPFSFWSSGASGLNE